jgi:hypothetical protein
MNHVHRWIKLAARVFRCDDWPRCTVMWLDGQIK